LYAFNGPSTDKSDSRTASTSSVFPATASAAHSRMFGQNPPPTAGDSSHRVGRQADGRQ
jgi:hypothetical protein